MPKMTEAEWREFVSAGTRTGKLATVRADGRPHIAPIWFVLDGNDVVFTTHDATVKARNLRRDPRISLCVDDDRPPFHYVVIEAEASLSEDLTDLREWATRLGSRYMGADRAVEFGERNGVPGELLVRAKINKVVAQRDIAGYE